MDYLFVQKYLKARNSHDIAVAVAFFFAIVSKLQRFDVAKKKVVYLMKEMLNKLSKVAKMECSQKPLFQNCEIELSQEFCGSLR